MAMFILGTNSTALKIGRRLTGRSAAGALRILKAILVAPKVAIVFEHLCQYDSSPPLWRTHKFQASPPGFPDPHSDLKGDPLKPSLCQIGNIRTARTY
jgi:hypothetical protein